MLVYWSSVTGVGSYDVRIPNRVQLHKLAQKMQSTATGVRSKEANILNKVRLHDLVYSTVFCYRRWITSCSITQQSSVVGDGLQDARILNRGML